MVDASIWNRDNDETRPIAALMCIQPKSFLDLSKSSEGHSKPPVIVVTRSGNGFNLQQICAMGSGHSQRWIMMLVCLAATSGERIKHAQPKCGMFQKNWRANSSAPAFAHFADCTSIAISPGLRVNVNFRRFWSRRSCCDT